MIQYRRTPTILGWELTLQCNMNCMHCGSAAGQTRTDELTTQEALSLCDQLKKFKVKNVSFTGGEPLLRKDWRIIAQKLRDLDIDINILTNAWIINNKTIETFKNLGVTSIAISIDGGTPHIHDKIRRTPGSFQKCIDTLEQLKKAGIPTTVITTVHRENFKELPIIKDLILGRTTAWQLQIAVPFGRFPKKLILSKKEFFALTLFIAATRKTYPSKQLMTIGAHSIGYHSQIIRNTMATPVWNGCQAGISTMTILSNGDIKGCLSLPDTYIEGNIRDTPIQKIWTDPTSFSYNRQFVKEHLTGACKTCKHGNDAGAAVRQYPLL